MSTSLRPVRSPPAAELSPELLLQMHSLMVKARVLEERLIQMYKQGDGYFWIGGPGEEAFNVPLGLLIHKGQGPQYDYCHFHYRNSATLLAMGADPLDAMRQMKNTSTDPYSGGRNFVGHYSIREWNVVPVSSPIEVQYSMAPGTPQKMAPMTIMSSASGGIRSGNNGMPSRQLVSILSPPQWGFQMQAISTVRLKNTVRMKPGMNPDANAPASTCTCSRS